MDKYERDKRIKDLYELKRQCEQYIRYYINTLIEIRKELVILLMKGE